jgi:hypothetical protein
LLTPVILRIGPPDPGGADGSAAGALAISEALALRNSMERKTRRERRASSSCRLTSLR